MGINSIDDEMWMRRAIELAGIAEESGEVPVGAVVAINNQIIGEAYNQPISLSDPSAHAEILALRSAGQALGNYRLSGATLYVTLEPCVMCAGAITHARIGRVVYGTEDLKSGALGSVYDIGSDKHLNHRFDVTKNILKEECKHQLQTFFRQRRK